MVKKTVSAICIFAVVSICKAASAEPSKHEVYGWQCKTASGEIVVKGIISPPFKVGQVVRAPSEPYGKAVGVKQDGACSQVRFDMDDGRTAMCEPFGIPVEHAFIGGWKFRPVDKSKCQGR
jgi:hypothetical protein